MTDTETGSDDGMNEVNERREHGAAPEPVSTPVRLRIKTASASRPGPTAPLALVDLTRWVKAVRALVDEALVEWSPEGLRVNAVDPAHVALVDVTLRWVALDGIEMPEAGDDVVDIEKLQGVLASVAGKAYAPVLTLSLQGRRLTVESEWLRRTLSVTDGAGWARPNVSAFSWPAEVTVDTTRLRQALANAAEVTDHLTLSVDPREENILHARAEGDGDDAMDARLRCSSYDVKEAVKSTFPLDYLSNLVGAVDTAAVLTLSLGKDYPVRLGFVVGRVQGYYILAPRIESE